MNHLRAFFLDARFGLRLLRRSPAFAVALLGVLVVGIGATTAMFSVVTSVLLRPLPFAHAEQLSMLFTVEPESGAGPVSARNFLDWKDQATAFSELTAVANASYSVSSDGEAPESLPAAVVSGDFFRMLAVAPLRGRLLAPEDDRLGGPKVAVISAYVWRRRFASDERVVGRTISLGAEPYTVVGVAPEGFRFSGPSSDHTDVWTPLAVARPNYAYLSSEEGRGSHFLDVFGRRKPGVSLAEANVQMATISARIEQAHPKHVNITARVMDLHDAMVDSSRQGIWVLFAAVGLVFLIICANVANLLLARAASRRSEMAARAALGATRGRLVAQLATETLVVFVLAALGGTALARVLVDALGTRILDNDALGLDLRLDWTALAFAVGFSAVCGVLVGLVPAADACLVPPQTVLKESAARASLGRAARLARGGLVVAQVALAFALLVGSGLAVRAFVTLASTPLGFEPEDLATATVVVPSAKYTEPGRISAFYREVVAKAAAEPGVTAVSANGSIPMGNSHHNGSFAIEGRPPFPAGARPVIERHAVMPAYFRTFGIPLIRGRDFTDADEMGGRRVMILSQSAAERFFPGEDPIGHRIDWGDDTTNDDSEHTWREIVGIVGDVRHLDGPQAVFPESYAPLAQYEQRQMTIVARTKRVPTWLERFPAIVASIDPQQAVARRRSMADRVASAIGPQRFTAQILGAFALVALALATLGIFGLVSYSTTQRTRELGIRLALGSTPEGLVALVMRDGVRLLATGLALGLLGAILVGRAIATRVAGAASFDPVLLVTILAVLAFFGMLASLLPALRAVRVPPAASLRHE